MSEQNLQEVWEIDVGGRIYQAAFAELSDWISEGSLKPEDKVRKESLRWIEARHVPFLVPFFNAKANNLPMPRTVTIVNPTAQDSAPRQPVAMATYNGAKAREINSFMCAVHSAVPSEYICDA
ncbi:MAG: hypothetical protein LC730_06660, partial [Acidobacteria bacterium]|nr:hypothetical protein [Acidobacteriota bacterium]